ncbi:UDP-glucose 6-dehydrogenase AglM [Halomicrococcus gelatinilyticus]|uniref:UDP-glucose 6-dehydrogenase AglM n=1 Tax=Halomicrococcus gelatinilyticus TaxID=1702103 RepID=UPI002E145D68
MKVSIVGSGYVGTTVAACLADSGHEVVNIDVDEDVVENLNDGLSSIHEPGLDKLIEKHGGDQLRGTTDYGAIRDTDVTFLALPTPSTDDGSIDLSVLKAGARSVGEALAEKDNYHLVVVKSTVIPGTAEDVLVPLLGDASNSIERRDFSIASNPEFLREGSAVTDFLDPDKIVFGTDGDERALDRLHDVYHPIIEETDAAVVETGRREAEMIKYANNAFLAAKISLINDIGNICKEFGVDAYDVADAMGLDDRIGERFLRSGVGWGGSCLPKDVAALCAAARTQDYEPALLHAAVEINERQPENMLALLDDHADVSDKRIAVLGLAFKPGTDDVRNSRAIPIIEGLRKRGAVVVAYDPVATENMRAQFPGIDYAKSATGALENSHGALVVTGWDEFTALSHEFERMADPIVVDGRRVINPKVLPDGATYEGLTW